MIFRLFTPGGGDDGDEDGAKSRSIKWKEDRLGKTHVRGTEGEEEIREMRCGVIGKCL